MDLGYASIQEANCSQSLPPVPQLRYPLMHENVTELLEALVAIDSVNPSLVPGGAGEAGMARFVMAWCAQHEIASTTAACMAAVLTT